MMLTVQVTHQADSDNVQLSGPINEESEVHLKNLLTQAGKNVTINFAQVTNVNSCGVRSWINFIRDFQKERSVAFEECTPEIINQINMIPNFKGAAVINSAFGDYTCPKCSSRQHVLLKKGENLPQTVGSAPTITCAKCPSTMELDELEEEYFAFVEAP